MKSFNMLSEDQVASLPFLDGGVMVLDGTVAEYFREFFATEKAKTVTIGGLHPDPAVHKPNFGGDYLYFTTDASWTSRRPCLPRSTTASSAS
ncbi:hypothetical protein DIPPA_09539 [Diplonema papillatum]|nr:hypothetical protein DIPPA_09539 [Diplonema papillatum]